MSILMTFAGALALIIVGMLSGLFVGKLGEFPGNGHKMTLGCAVAVIVIAAALLPRIFFREDLAALLSISLLGGFFAAWLGRGVQQRRMTRKPN